MTLDRYRPLNELKKEFKPCFPKTQWRECQWFIQTDSYDCKYVIWADELNDDGNRFRFCSHWKEIENEIIERKVKHETKATVVKIFEGLLFDV